jgi:hypothetical protein
MVFRMYRSWAEAVQDALPALIPLGMIGALTLGRSPPVFVLQVCQVLELLLSSG